MKENYSIYPPKKLYISFVGRQATEPELWAGAKDGIIYHYKSGIEVLDMMMDYMHKYMDHRPSFYAQQFSVTSTQLSGFLRVTTGLSAEKWIEEYLNSPRATSCFIRIGNSLKSPPAWDIEV